MNEKQRWEKEKDEPQFSVDDRGFNVKAWYLKDNPGLDLKGDALIEVRYGEQIIRQFVCPAYKIYNIVAHFGDIVDGELSKDDKERGYLLAGSTGFGGYVLPQPLPRSPQENKEKR